MALIPWSRSIVRTTDRISKIIDIAEIPLAAFEYQEDMKDVFVTSRLNELLDLPEGGSRADIQKSGPVP